MRLPRDTAQKEGHGSVNYWGKQASGKSPAVSHQGGQQVAKTETRSRQGSEPDHSHGPAWPPERDLGSLQKMSVSSPLATQKI